MNEPEPAPQPERANAPERTEEPDRTTADNTREPLTGQDDHAQNRANPGEGGRAPSVEDSDSDVPEYSIFDGKGNESVVVVGGDDDGEHSLGTGADREAALKNMKNTKEKLGPDFSPGP